MSKIGSTRKSKAFRLWSVPLLLAGVGLLTGVMGTGSTHHALLGGGMILGGIFAFRHDLMDLSPEGLDPRKVGLGWVALLVASVLMVGAAAIVAFTA